MPFADSLSSRSPQIPCSRRQALFGAGAFLGLAACGQPHLDAGEGILRVIGPWDLGGFDPTKSGAMFSRLQIAETLIESDNAGTPLPGLATGWTTSPDGLVWTFRLRPAVLFHDGSTLNAAHTAWALRRAMEPPATLSLAPVADITSQGDDMVIIRLTKPFAPLLHLLSHTSTQIWAPAAFGPNGDVRNVIASGPYRLTRFEPPLRMDTAFFAGHRGGPRSVKGSAYMTVSRMETRTLIAEGRQADLIYSIDAPSARHILADSRNQIIAAQMPRTLILKVNSGNPKLADLRVRRAISLAIDRQGIASGILLDPSLAAGQLFPPMLQGWHDPDLPPLGRNVEQAGDLLSQAGWLREGDGIRRRDDQSLHITLKTYSDRAELPVLAAALQEQLRLVGIAVEVQINNSSDIPLSHRDKTVELALVARNYANFVDPTISVIQDFGRGGGDFGATGWVNRPVEQAIDDLLTHGDPDGRRRRGIAQVLQAELPVIPISWYMERVALSDRVAGGVSFDPYERTLRIADVRLAGGRS
ncbi:ABC transporter substrate-binding protein [Altererythrobacter xixiisoli]|uniref:ABC transporter substrate-binding protein n=1 Tax=Croceibacterium xixiisoli TaxID=1476466 RepID=A0A6I4TZ14_9SPHN|nr:ABC transporter substrate-binding protein [Croceibacterium xixiisoli]MXP00302.1 ABC transporter substrate-binding protein [Croceibacterium xixiisoli]